MKQLLDNIMELTGKTLTEIADENLVNRTTLLSYYAGRSEMPYFRLIQLIKKYGIGWSKVGESIEADYPIDRVQKLIAKFKPKTKG